MSLSDPQGKKVNNPADDGAVQLNTHEAYGELTIGATPVTETVASPGTEIELADATNMSAGESLNCTVSATTGRITVPAAAGGGKYLCIASGQIAGANAATLEVGIRVNGADDAAKKREAVMPAAAAKTPFSLSFILDLDVDDYVSLWVDSTACCDTVDVEHLGFQLIKLKDDNGI